MSAQRDTLSYTLWEGPMLTTTLLKQALASADPDRRLKAAAHPKLSANLQRRVSDLAETDASLAFALAQRPDLLPEVARVLANHANIGVRAELARNTHAPRAARVLARLGNPLFSAPTNNPT
jgi:hypothetical protein